jgi:hypothetical protein
MEGDMKINGLVLVLLAASCGGVAPEAASQTAALTARPRGPVIHRPRGATNLAASATNTSGPNGIDYHGGPLLYGTPNVYYIWYGNWANNSAVSILTDLASTLGSSHYFTINNSYSNLAGQWVTGALHYAGATTDSYSRGSSLSDGDVFTIVSNAITSGRLPLDSNGVYLVLSSSDVTEGAFCTQFCGWHYFGTVSNTTIKYGWIGDAHARCPGACMAQTVGPNGNAGADGMASVIAHEIAESVTDPEVSAWYDGSGEENADKCAWTFGTEYTANGAHANVHLGNRDFLLQQNWVNSGGGYCDLARFRALGPDDPIVFDGNFYLALYPDLRAAFGSNLAAARNHWLTYGINEGRRASRQFDSVTYVSFYPDLMNAFGSNHAAALNHFLLQGLPYEARRAAREFDVSYYRNAYPDLNTAFGPDYVAQAHHFITFGLTEGRASALELDVSAYLGYYVDLQNAFGNNHQAALDHFITNGLNEGRRSSAAFFVSYYLSLYPDLQAAFGPTNYPAAFNHWVVFGRNEGRRGAP